MNPSVLQTMPVDVVLQRAFDGIITINTEQRIIAVDDGTELLFGYCAGDLVGQLIDVLIPARFVEDHRKHVSEFLQSPDFVRPIKRRLRVVFGRHKDGHDISLEAIFCKSLPEESQSTTMSVFLRDISTRQQAEIAIQQQEDYFRALVENSSDAIMLFNPDGSRRYISPSAEKVFGQAMETLISNLSKSYFHPDDVHVMDEAVKSVLANPSQTITVSYRVRQEDGGWRWIESMLKNLCHDPRVGAIVVNNRNITEHHSVEQALRESRKHYEDLLTAVPVGVYEADGEGSCTFVNEKWCEMAGLQPMEALGNGWLEGLYPDDRQRVLDEWDVAMAHKQPFNFEYRLGKEDGQITWVLGRALATLDDSDAITGYIGTVTDITERIYAERALRESETRFRQLFNASPIPIGLNRLSDGRHLDVNDAFCEYTGWSREETIGKTSIELGLWPTEADRKAMVERIRSGRSLRNIESRLRIRSGEIRTVLHSMDIMPVDGVECLIVAATDITEQQKAVALIKRHNRLLNTLSAVNELLLQETDTQRLLEKTCRVLVEKAGFLMAWIGIPDQNEGTVTPVAKAGVGEDYFSKVTIRFDDSQWGQGPTGTAIRENRTVVILDIDVDPRYSTWRETAHEYGFRSSAAIPLRHHDRVFGSLNVYSANVNDFGPDELPLLERMSSDLGFIYERLEMQKALQESENRLASFFSEAPAGLVLYDKDLRFIQVNPTLARTGNMSQTDLKGKRPREVLPSPMAKFIEESINAVFKTGEAKINEEVSGSVPADSDSVRYWMHSHFPVKDTEGRVYAVGGFVIETTVLKQAEEALKRLNQELETRVNQRTEALAAVNAELESFAYSVSHDLRAPLRSIDGFSRILLEDYEDTFDAEGKEHLDRIIKSVNRMGALIDAMLALSRLSRKELKLQGISGEKLTSIVRELIQEIDTENASQKIDWQLEPLSPCYADLTLLRQVWANLLRNAAKYSSGKDHSIVQIGMLNQDEKKIYYVRDNGIGFDMKYVDKLFGVFQRLHRQTEFEGTGIGLATVKRIIGILGGRIWAEAEVNKGATFYFTLP